MSDWLAKARLKASSAASSAASALSSAASSVASAAASRLLAKYDVIDCGNSATPLQGGVHGLWMIAHARNTKTNQEVSIWTFDKRKYTSDPRYNKVQSYKSAVHTLFDIIRRDGSLMAKLIHPRVLKLVEPFEETAASFTVVTEPVVGSLHDVCGNVREFDLGVAEVLAGGVQLAQAIEFLHTAGLVHRGISPWTCVVAEDGSWKLGLGFVYAKTSVEADELRDAFNFPPHDANDGPPIHAQLAYTAPELAHPSQPNASTAAASATPMQSLMDFCIDNTMGAVPSTVAMPPDAAADIFSLGAVMFRALSSACKSQTTELISCKGNAATYRRMLLDAPNSTGGAGARLHELRNLLARSGSAMMNDANEPIFDLLSNALSQNPSSRPSAANLTRHPAFMRPETQALGMLDNLLAVETVPKVQFLQSLAGLLPAFNVRVKKSRVLPPLLDELRNANMQSIVLPLVLEVGQSLNSNDFSAAFRPHLASLCSNATGESLLLLCSNVPRLQNILTDQAMAQYLIPLLVRGCSESDVRVHVEVLKHIPGIFSTQRSNYAHLQMLLPQVKRLALETTAASVRVNALKTIASVMPHLSKEEVDGIIAMLGAIADHDRSSATALCVAGVIEAASKSGGIERECLSTLPLLITLLANKSLSLSQFETLLSLVNGSIQRVGNARRKELKEQADVQRTISQSGGMNTTSSFGSMPQPALGATMTAGMGAADPFAPAMPSGAPVGFGTTAYAGGIGMPSRAAPIAGGQASTGLPSAGGHGGFRISQSADPFAPVTSSGAPVGFGTTTYAGGIGMPSQAAPSARGQASTGLPSAGDQLANLLGNNNTLM